MTEEKLINSGNNDQEYDERLVKQVNFVHVFRILGHSVPIGNCIL